MSERQRNKRSDRKDSNKNNKFDSKFYNSNLGNEGTFFKNKDDKKGTKGTLLAVAKDGVFAQIKNSPFNIPAYFERGVFDHAEGEMTLNGQRYKITPIGKGDSKRSSNKKSSNKGSHKNSYSDNGKYGKFGKNGGEKAHALIEFLEETKHLDQHNDADYEEIVECTKDLMESFN